MQRIPTASGSTGPKNVRRGPMGTRVRRVTPQAYQTPPDYADVPMPSGFTAEGPVTVVEGPRVKTVTSGVLPRYKETS
jgi:hypothetical protein